MIISPPILKTSQGNTSDEQWLASLMPFSSRGGFPIASRMAWHGGQHIEHTDTGPHGEPVRAIADGVVVYKRAPSPDADKKPLAYQGATDNGCVVIKHNTEIGEGPDGQIEYYSIYMHLKQVFVKNKQPVNRKDSLGSVGSCNGKNAMHLEIICDDANLKKIVGRSTGKLDISKDGRDNIVYGDMHFYLPPGTPFFAAIASPQASTGNGAAAHTSAAPLFVTMCFERGKCLLSTRQEDPQHEGLFIEIGAALANSDDKYEYNIYSKATTLGDAFHVAPSSAYELLRFGRVINTENETRIEEGVVPHWHKVNYPGGQGWVNLNATGVKKFSDADFPHWLGWTLINDDSTPDSQCNSPTIEKWITGSSGKEISKETLSAALSDAKLQSRLSRTICKFPTEWEKGQIDTQYGWLKKKSDVLEDPMTDESYAEFKAHVEALSFWEEARIEINNTHWHFHPKLFLLQFRKNGWLSKEELRKIYPNQLYNKQETPDPESLREKYRICINRVVAKYLIDQSKTRMTHFYGQGAVESFYLARMQEASVTPSRNPSHPSVTPETNGFYNNTDDAWYVKYNNNKNLSNGPAPDGVKYRGRGMKQLTGRLNHNGYWIYRGWREVSLKIAQTWQILTFEQIPDIADPQRISIIPFNCIDAGGFYWERGARRAGYKSMNKIINQNDVSQRAITSVSFALNGGNMGLDERIKHTTRISRELLDETNK
ncbi:peptidoglycan DD-metalloendopeptidase family protein [Vogesella sp. LIG4]|uniref:peptidoglycan DD-metalloendopeptidase family protein n=1 Tax=Vogesella sp. LIG4 TaxID=1192162 RepID=UPI00081FC445|nr:peptidoglycan DD-metalloendopeptidase family protein [Vogesella sp. LIG4]SCK21605.1 hydroxyethylthiazole kinase [Vogesella sp. LIG4]